MTLRFPGEGGSAEPLEILESGIKKWPTYYKELIFDVNVMLCISDDLAVCILYAAFGKDPTAPVATAPDNLGLDRSLSTSFFRCHITQWMIHISLPVSTAITIARFDNITYLPRDAAAAELQ